MPDTPNDPEFPPTPPEGECGTQYNGAVKAYWDMKKAESDAMNAVEKARNVAGAAAVACGGAMLIPGPPVRVPAYLACIAASAKTLETLNDAKSKNDVFGIAVQAYQLEMQRLRECIDSKEIFTP